MPIVAAGALSHGGLLRWWLALPVCIAGVLSGDMVPYWTGRHWGERVLNWRVIRWVLTLQREAWLKDAYCRHAVKTVVTVRHVVGLRAAAFLTAGIARVPFWKFMADAGAALIGVPFRADDRPERPAVRKPLAHTRPQFFVSGLMRVTLRKRSASS
jgi:membrane protein DedA with SNARE-associated domain